jgi:predicted DNA-binding protein (MmcQ/YjbR family)
MGHRPDRTIRGMSHPRTYRDEDQYLADVRRIALSFPEASEVEAWGRPTFRAGKKMFAVWTNHEGHGFGVVFKPEADERPALLEDERFYVPPYFGPAGWLALDLTAGRKRKVDWDEVTELLEGSYRQVALKRMLAKLDG